MGKHQALIRTALLLALTLVFQSLRFLIPLPVLLSTIMIGSLVNACLVIAVRTLGIWSAITIAVLAPIIAYYQQLLPLPLFIFPVSLGNAVFVFVYQILNHRLGHMQMTVIAALCKTLCLYGAFSWLLETVNLPVPMATGILFVMGWPQLLTGIAGGLVAKHVVDRLKSI